MALRYLIGTGNVADPTKWDGGVSVPSVGDDCYANGFTGTITANFTVNSLNTTASGPAAAGGGFTTSSVVTITCAGGFYAGTTTCLTIVVYGTAIGPAYGSNTTASRYGISVSNGSTHIGDSHGGSAGAAYGTSLQSAATQYGTAYAGSGSRAFGSSVLSGAVLVGNSVGGSVANSRGASLNNGGTQVGDAMGGSAAGAWGSTATNGGQIYGRCYGGSNATAYGATVSGGGIVIPTLIVSSTGPGLNVANDGVVILQGSTTLAQLDITASAGRYLIERGTSILRPFIRPPIYPAFAS